MLSAGLPRSDIARSYLAARTAIAFRHPPHFAWNLPGSFGILCSVSDSLVSEPRPGRLSRLAWIVAALPPLLLAVGTITGVGLLRGAPASLALAGGIALAGLPALGIAAGLGGRAPSPAVASWAWSLVLLAALPLYFPGERSEATREGLAWLASFAGPERADRLSALGVELVEQLGDDPEPLPLAPPFDEEIARAWSEPAREAEGALVRLEEDAEAPEPLAPRVARIDYEGDGRSMRVGVVIDGPAFGEQLALIFDTGATFTTLNREALRLIGVPVPRDAPWVTLRTANGNVEAPLVLVDAVWLGEEVVEWVTIAV